MRRALRGLVVAGLPLLFLGSCVSLTPVSMRLAAPMTHSPLSAPPAEFPVLVVTGERVHIERIDDVSQPPVAKPGSTYLVPLAKVREFQQQLQEPAHRVTDDGGWVLRVEELAPNRQRIDLVWMADGFRGGVYDATPTTITPLYEKLTGPGFAFVSMPIALALNTLLWLPVWLVLLWRRRRRRQRHAQYRHQASAGSSPLS
jgi:hypothetical protein